MVRTPSNEVQRLAVSAIGKLAEFGADAGAAEAALVPLAMKARHPQTQQYAIRALKKFAGAAGAHVQDLRDLARNPAQRDYVRAAAATTADAGARRNFQILAPLDFLAEFTQHIPPKGAHLVRYYGWYSNKARGVRQKAAQALAEAATAPEPATVEPKCGSNPTWAMLIKRVYEVDPLVCSRCGGRMKVVAFIEPPQEAVIEEILRHCGLWPESARAPSARAGLTEDPEAVPETVCAPSDAFPAEL